MKPTSVLVVAAASIAILGAACKKHDEPAGETNTTSAPITPDEPAAAPLTTGTMEQAAPNDLGKTTGGAAFDGVTSPKTIRKECDAGRVELTPDTTPTGGSDLIDPNARQGIAPSQTTPKGPLPHSRPTP